MVDLPNTEPASQDNTESPTESRSSDTILAWTSLVCGLLALVSLPFINGGIPGVSFIAIITGVRVLYRIEPVAPKLRTLAKIGTGLGIAKIALLVGVFAWIIFCFAINPIAH